MFWKVFLHHRVTNYIMAWAGLLDGLVGVITFGFVYSSLSYKFSSWHVRNAMSLGIKVYGP